jgi:hypothetical protein
MRELTVTYEPDILYVQKASIINKVQTKNTFCRQAFCVCKFTLQLFAKEWNIFTAYIFSTAI